MIERSVVNNLMDYWGGMDHSPVYEFPYSGSHASSLPFLNYHPNGYSSHYQHQYHDPLLTPTHYGSNAIVYHIPGLYHEEKKTRYGF